MKLNIGCGKVYINGWTNLDNNKEVKADVYADIEKKLPFKDKTFDRIICDNVLEHIPQDKIRGILEEFIRVLKLDGKLEIYAPHFTGILVKYLGHYKGYGVNSFCDERDLFKVVDKELILVSRCSSAGYKSLRFLNRFNFLFNFNKTWQQLCEKFWFGGFEEIHYTIRR